MATNSRINFSCRMHVTHLHNFFNFSTLTPNISKKLSRTPIDIYVVFDQFEDAEFENDVKTGIGSSYRRHFAENRIFGCFFLRGQNLNIFQCFSFQRKRPIFGVMVADMCAYKMQQKFLFKRSHNSFA